MNYSSLVLLLAKAVQITGRRKTASNARLVSGIDHLVRKCKQTGLVV